jgi:spermidine/putrescine transport system ATP-binding protein
MSEGHIEQVGSPREVYEEPVNAYVADFLGVSNLMDAETAGGNGVGVRVRLGEFELVAEAGDLSARGRVKIVVRPERVRIEPHGQSGGNRVPAMVERAVYVGATTQLVVRLAPGQVLQAMIANDGGGEPYRQGSPVTVVLEPSALRVLEVDPYAASGPPLQQQQP